MNDYVPKEGDIYVVESYRVYKFMALTLEDVLNFKDRWPVGRVHQEENEHMVSEYDDWGFNARPATEEEEAVYRLVGSPEL